MKAIVYSSHAGHTREYATLLASKTGLPALSLQEAMKSLESGSEIIYLGWLMAGNIMGYDKAVKPFRIMATIGIGMGDDGSQIDDCRAKCHIPSDTPVFTVCGGFEMEKVHGFYKIMMLTMRFFTAKKMQKKADRTPQEEAALEMITKGRSYVDMQRLTPFLECYNKQ